MSRLAFSGYRTDGRRSSTLVAWQGNSPVAVPWGVAGPADLRRQPFDWGHDTEGTRHTAYAILYAVSNEQIADMLYEDFARLVLSRMQPEAFHIDSDAVMGWIVLWIGNNATLARKASKWKEGADAENN